MSCGKCKLSMTCHRQEKCDYTERLNECVREDHPLAYVSVLPVDNIRVEYIVHMPNTYVWCRKYAALIGNIVRKELYMYDVIFDREEISIILKERGD